MDVLPRILRFVLVTIMPALVSNPVHAAEPSVLSHSTTISLPRHATAIVVDEPTRHVFVATLVHTDDFGNPTGTGNVIMLDATTGHILHSTTIAQAATAMAVDSRAGRVYVYCLGPINTYKQSKGPGVVEVLDASTGAIVGTANVGGGDANQWPQLAMAVDTIAAHLFVADLNDNAVTMLDAKSGKVLHIEAVGARPNQIAVDELVSRAFVINNGDDTMSVINTRTGKSEATLPLGKYPSTIVTDPQLGRVYVGNLGFDKKSNPANGQVLFFDAKSLKRSGSTTVGKEPYSFAVDPQSGLLFVVNRASNSVSTLDGESGRLLRTAKTLTDPIIVKVSARTGHAYIASELSGVTVILVKTGAPMPSISADDSGLIAVSEQTGKLFVTGASSPTTLTIAATR